MDAFQVITIIVGLIAIVGAAYQFKRWITPRIRRYLAARRYRRSLPELRMQAMAERISALENQLTWQKDYVELVVKDMFAMNWANIRSDGHLFDILRDMLESRGKDIESDRESTVRLIQILEGYSDQIDHLWEAYIGILTLIEAAVKPSQESQDNPSETAELKSA